MPESIGLRSKNVTEKIEQLRLDEIVKNPYQPRIEFDQEKLNELAASIKENGVLQPITVRKSQLIGYELLAGERRFQASKIAKLTTIPAIVRAYSDKEMMTLSIIENLQRENLNPFEEAKSLALLCEKLELSHSEIGRKLGKSRAYVSNTLRILKLPPSLLTEIKHGRLSAAHGRTLLAEKNPKRQIELANRVIHEQISVRELENLVYNSKDNVDKLVKFDKTVKKDIFVTEVERELMKTIGNTVKITTNKKFQGTLSLKFNNLDELEKLIDQLQKNR